MLIKRGCTVERVEAGGKIWFSLDQNHPLGRFKGGNRLLCDLASDASMLEDRLLIRKFNRPDRSRQLQSRGAFDILAILEPAIDMLGRLRDLCQTIRMSKGDDEHG